MVSPASDGFAIDDSRALHEWGLDQLRALADGADVEAEGDPAAVEHLLEALRPGARATRSVGAFGRGLHNVHPLDRLVILAAWRHALEHPGVVTETVARTSGSGAWVESRQRFLCLRGHPTFPVSCILSDGALDGVDVPDPDALAVQGTAARWMLLHATTDGIVEDVEGTVEELIGGPIGAIVDTITLDLVHPDDRPAGLAVLSAALGAPGTAVSVEHRLQRLDGRTVWVESTMLIEAHRPHPWGDLAEPTLVVLVVDISHRRAQEAALQTSREESVALAEEFRLLAEEVPSGVFRADLGGTIQFANSQFLELAGGRRIDHLRELAHPEDRPLVEAARAEVVARHADDAPPADGTVSVEFRSAVAGGEMRALRIRVPRTRSGGVGMIGVLTDLTSTAQLRHQARTDPLTGLLNRTALDDHIAELIEAGGGVAAMFVDLDEFKQVNDANGHHAGDEVLRVIAKRLRSCVRASEMVTRYGGDEFVIVCSDPSPATLENLGERVQGVLADPVHVDTAVWSPAASIGIAVSEPGDGPADVLRRADHAMYLAKRARRSNPET